MARNPIMSRLLARGRITPASVALAQRSKEAARALPSSKGGETPLQLETYRLQIQTYFTQASATTELMYSAENWVELELKLETAGPVSVGTDANLAPVNSGRGQLLDTNSPLVIQMPKGTRLYVTSQTVNRINLTIKPIPWLEQIDVDNNRNQIAIKAAIGQIGSDIVDAIGSLATAVTAAMGTTAAPPPYDVPDCPPPSGGMVPRVNRIRLPPMTAMRRGR